MQANLDTIRELGAEVYGVHGYDSRDSDEWQADMGLSFRLMADPGLQLIKTLGIYNRDRIPHPTTIIVDPEGIMRFRDVHVAYQNRTSAEVIVDVLKRMQQDDADADRAPNEDP